MSTPKPNSFDALFERHMKGKNVAAFKHDYRTLYNEVIRPIEAERDAFSNEVMKQRETIKEMHEALQSTLARLLEQPASIAGVETLYKVREVLLKSRYQNVRQLLLKSRNQ